MLRGQGKRIFARYCIGFVLVLVAVTAYGQAPTRIKFTMDWRVEGPSVFFLLPLAKGYFKDEGLDVTVDVGVGSAAAVQRISSGAYEMGAGDMSSVIEFLGNQPGPATLQAVYLIYESAPLAMFAYKKSGIKTPKDFEGKRLGGPVFNAVRKAFPLVVQANKLDPAKINWVTMEPAMQEQMLVRGEVDAVGAFFATGLLNLQSRGAKPEELVWFRLEDIGVVNLYGNAILASTKLIQENPKAVAGFVRAFNRGFKEIVANPEAAIPFVKQRDALIDEKLELQRLKLALENIATPNAKADGFGSIRAAKLANQVEDVTLAYGLKSKPNASGIFNASFLPPPAERKP